MSCADFRPFWSCCWGWGDARYYHRVKRRWRTPAIDGPARSLGASGGLIPQQPQQGLQGSDDVLGPGLSQVLLLLLVTRVAEEGHLGLQRGREVRKRVTDHQRSGRSGTRRAQRAVEAGRSGLEEPELTGAAVDVRGEAGEQAAALQVSAD